jgi:hypothetical protein
MPKKESLTTAALACEDRLVLLDQDATRLNLPSHVMDCAGHELETYTKALDASKNPRSARETARKEAFWRSRAELDRLAAESGIPRRVIDRFVDDVEHAYRFIERAWRNAR